MSLNELPAAMVNKLPPTDSRLRPDIRKLEEGDVGMYGAEFFASNFNVSGGVSVLNCKTSNFCSCV